MRKGVRESLGLGSEAPIVVNENERYRLQGDLFEVDVREFCELYADVKKSGTELGEPHLRRMLALYGGDLLSDVQEEWCTRQRRKLQVVFSDACTRLIGHADKEQERIHLIGLALRVDGLNEALHQERMKNYALLGRKDAVHRSFQDLQEELRKCGEKPSAESRGLFESLMR